MRSTTLAAILILTALAACSGSTAASALGTAGSSVAVNPGGPGQATPAPTCHVTRPDPVFTAPSPYPPQPPASYGSSWFGSPALWTMLKPDGETWRGLPRDKIGYSQKTFWWSAAWDVAHELEPAIGVTGRQLDGPATFAAGDPGTNAGADFGEAMLVGVVLPAPGCWQLTATYRGATLSIVVWVAGD